MEKRRICYIRSGSENHVLPEGGSRDTMPKFQVRRLESLLNTLCSLFLHMVQQRNNSISFPTSHTKTIYVVSFGDVSLPAFGHSGANISGLAPSHNDKCSLVGPKIVVLLFCQMSTLGKAHQCLSRHSIYGGLPNPTNPSCTFHPDYCCVAGIQK